MLYNGKIRCIKEGYAFKEGDVVEVIDGKVKYTNDKFCYLSMLPVHSIGEINDLFVAQFEKAEDTAICHMALNFSAR